MAVGKLGPKFHGVMTIILILAAIGVGIAAIALKTALGALIYAAVIVLALPLLIHLFCGKCVCRETNCLMVYPAKLYRRLPGRRDGDYTGPDLAAIVGILVLLVAVPQYWLWQTKALFIAFWILIFGAHAEVMTIVCRACENCRCPVYRFIESKKR